MNPIRLGFIGVANQGTYNLKAFFKHDDCVVKAVCDVDDGHLAAATPSSLPFRTIGMR